MELIPIEKVKRLLRNPKDWVSIPPIEFNPGKYYCKLSPEFIIEYKHFEDNFLGYGDRGAINDITSDFYWISALPRPFHHIYMCHFEIRYYSTVLFYAQVISSDNNRFERILWDTNHLTFNGNEKSIKYAYIEKDSLSFLIDEWLCNKWTSYDDVFPIQYHNSIESENSEYADIYKMIPVFSTHEEHKEFKRYVLSNEADFIHEIGDCKEIYFKDQSVIEYKCKVGKTLVNWLNEWRNLKRHN